MTTNVFKELNDVNVSDKIERKGKLSYLSWAWAWAELKKKYPLATSKVYEREDGRIYWDDGRGAWVKCSVTVDDLEHIEFLPLMDFHNKAIPVEKITLMEINKAIQRAITKAIARHGLGLYIYAGEDLPEESDGKQQSVKNNTTSDLPEDYIVPFGKFRDKRLGDLEKKDVSNYLKYLADESKKTGEPLGKNAEDLLKIATELYK